MAQSLAKKPQDILEKQVKILLIEDHKREAFLIETALGKARPGQFNLAHVTTLEAALPKISEEHFDVVLLDLSLPGTSGLEAMKHLHAFAPHLPIVILTGQNDERIALNAIHQGAQDYLIKDGVSGGEIMRSARYAMQRKKFEDRLITLANYDLLTGLANRSLFENRLELAINRSERNGDAVAILFLDLDRFKNVNDTLGHEAGDVLLTEVGKRLKKCLRGYDIIARFGGDEFAVLIEGVPLPRSLAAIAKKLIRTLDEPFVLEAGEASIGASIGIAIAAPGVMAGDLMKQADIAMYRAKSAVGSDYQFYTETIHHETIRRLALEEDLAAAMKTMEQFQLHYQPKLDGRSSELVGAEALLRWQHHERGTIAPEDFLLLMQGTSWAIELDTWVLSTVCHDIQSWITRGGEPPQISVHLSDSLWRDRKVAEMLQSILKDTGIPARFLAIEVEEAIAKRDVESAEQLMAHIRDLGAGVHLDNFGADASSIKTLLMFPFDVIKIDRHMIQDIGRRPGQGKLAKSLMELGHDLGMKMGAEGVETDAQKSFLTYNRCDQIQGKIISMPLPGENFFRQWLRK